MSEISTVQDTMVEALYQGNIDQVGRLAWVTMVDLVQETVACQVAEWKDEISDDEIDQYKATQIDLIKQLEEATEGEKPAIWAELNNILAKLNGTVN